MGYTIDDRFQVSCSCCGYLTGERTFYDAKRSANLAELRHNAEYEHIEIFDIMAHVGKPELFTSDGQVIRERIK